MRDGITVDVAVVGGGPAGLSAGLWAARYRRRVIVFEGGTHRNDATRAAHGYFGHEGVAPATLLDHGRAGLAAYPEAERCTAAVADVTRAADGFTLQLADGGTVYALRLVLATGVRDVFPDIDGFRTHFGTSIFTCPSCDGYEAQGKHVVVLGDDDDLAGLALGLLDWAGSVTVVCQADAPHVAELEQHGIEVVTAVPVAFLGGRGELTGIRLDNDRTVPADMVFCTIDHEPGSDLAARLGCAISEEGCVLVDEHGLTSVEHVYAAGDMTPGPHLVQVAAAEGAVAGIAAAMSLRGERGAPGSPRPAPDAEAVLDD